MVHRLLFQPAIGMARMHDHDFGRVVFPQPLDDRLGNRAGGKILAFGIDEPLRPTDMLQIELFDLVDGVPVAISGAGSRYADLDIFELGGERVWPRIARAILDFRQFAATRAGPPIATQIGQRLRNIALHHHGSVVPRGVRLPARGLATRIVLLVVARVPSLVGHVDPTTDRDDIVQHGDLLMVRTADRVCRIELEGDAAMAKPARKVPPHGRATDSGQCANAPFEQANVQLLAMPGQPGDETSEARRVAPLPRALPPAAPSREMDAGIEIPPDQQDASPRF